MVYNCTFSINLTGVLRADCGTDSSSLMADFGLFCFVVF